MSDKTLQNTEEANKKYLLDKIASNIDLLWLLAHVLFGIGIRFDIPILLPISIVLNSIAFITIVYTFGRHFKTPDKKSIPWKLIYRLFFTSLLFVAMYYYIN